MRADHQLITISGMASLNIEPERLQSLLSSGWCPLGGVRSLGGIRGVVSIGWCPQQQQQQQRQNQLRLLLLLLLLLLVGRCSRFLRRVRDIQVLNSRIWS